MLKIIDNSPLLAALIDKGSASKVVLPGGIVRLVLFDRIYSDEHTFKRLNDTNWQHTDQTPEQYAELFAKAKHETA
jgi:hypothetical protein